MMHTHIAMLLTHAQQRYLLGGRAGGGGGGGGLCNGSYCLRCQQSADCHHWSSYKLLAVAAATWAVT